MKVSIMARAISKSQYKRVVRVSHQTTLADIQREKSEVTCWGPTSRNGRYIVEIGATNCAVTCQSTVLSFFDCDCVFCAYFLDDIPNNLGWFPSGSHRLYGNICRLTLNYFKVKTGLGGRSLSICVCAVGMKFLLFFILYRLHHRVSMM